MSIGGGVHMGPYKNHPVSSARRWHRPRRRPSERHRPGATL